MPARRARATERRRRPRWSAIVPSARAARGGPVRRCLDEPADACPPRRARRGSARRAARRARASRRGSPQSRRRAAIAPGAAAMVRESAVSTPSGDAGRAGRREVGRRIRRVRRVMGAIHADADRDRQPPIDAFPFDQDAGELVPSSRRSFGHLRARRWLQGRREFGRSHHAARAPRRRTIRRRVGRRRIGRAAGLRRDCPACGDPGAAAPAPPGGLPPRDDPQRPALAARAPARALPHWSSRSCRSA